MCAAAKPVCGAEFSTPTLIRNLMPLLAGTVPEAINHLGEVGSSVDPYVCTVK